MVRFPPLLAERVTALPLKVRPPLIVAVPEVLVAAIVIVPLEPERTFTRFAKEIPLPPSARVTASEPLVSPRLMVLVKVAP